MFLCFQGALLATNGTALRHFDWPTRDSIPFKVTVPIYFIFSHSSARCCWRPLRLQTVLMTRMRLVFKQVKVNLAITIPQVVKWSPASCGSLLILQLAAWISANPSEVRFFISLSRSLSLALSLSFSLSLSRSLSPCVVSLSCLCFMHRLCVGRGMEVHLTLAYSNTKPFYFFPV